MSAICDSIIDRLKAEGLIGIAAAARHIGFHPASLRRWCLRGATATTGGRVRLEHVRTPGKMLTTLPALERFMAAVGTPIEQVPDVRTPAKRHKAAEDAEAILRRIGV